MDPLDRLSRPPEGDPGRKPRRLRDPAVSVPLLLVVLTTALTLFNPPVLDESVETLLLDLRFKLRNLVFAAPAPENIVIVAIDEKSLSAHGRWPWSRTLQASLMEKVLACEPAALAVDIFYPESESPEDDRALAQTLGRYRERVVVALGFDVEDGKTFTGEIPDPLYDMAIPRIENLRFLRPLDAHRVLLPPEPVGTSGRFGHVYSLPDRDGKLRWDALYLRMGDEYFPSLPLQTARIARGLPLDEIRVVGGTGVRLGEVQIPTDAFGRMHINYRGREGTFPYVSAREVLAGKVPCAALHDKIVFIGTSAIATYDLKTTPFSANMPGVEKNATVVSNILAQDPIRQTPLLLNLSVVLVFGLLLVWLGQVSSARNTLLIYLFAAFLYTLGNVLLFSLWGLRVNLAYPLFMVAAMSMFVISFRYLTEERRARDIRKIFSSYVTERVVNELIKHPELTRLGGERREITVLFSDIRDFTVFSEANEPEEVVTRLNEFLGAMTEVIFHWEGTLDKFVGDEIMAFWGAPILQENHAETAVRCALHMVKRLGELQESWKSRGMKPLDIGIGINTGEVIVGNIGAEGKKMEYTVIGDAVNLGARTEALTRRYDTHILVTEFTYKKIRDHVHSRRIGHCLVQGLEIVRVKGKERPVKIFKIASLEHGTESVIREEPEPQPPPAGEP